MTQTRRREEERNVVGKEPICVEDYKRGVSVSTREMVNRREEKKGVARGETEPVTVEV